MPGTEAIGRIAGEAFITTLLPEWPHLIGEAALLANVDPVQVFVIGEAALLCIVEQTIPATTSRRQPVSGDLQWVDQP